MDENIARTVRALRARDPFNPMTISTAFAIAKYDRQAAPEQYPWLEDLDEDAPEVVGDAGKGVTIHVRIEPDTDSYLGDDDVTGTFTDTESDTTVRNRFPNWGSDGNFYQPSNMRLSDTPAAHARTGMSRARVREYMAWLVQADMRDDAHRHYYGMVVTIEVDGLEVGRASLWSIDTIDGYPSRGYFLEVAYQLIGEALDEARASMPKRVKRARKRVKRLQRATRAL